MSETQDLPEREALSKEGKMSTDEERSDAKNLPKGEALFEEGKISTNEEVLETQGLYQKGALSNEGQMSEKQPMSNKGELSRKEALSEKSGLSEKEPISNKKELSRKESLSEEGRMSEKEPISDQGELSETEALSQNEDELSQEGDTSEEGCWWESWEEGDDLIEYGALNGWYDKASIANKVTVPLKKINVKVAVNGTSAEVCVQQRYVNTKRRTLKDLCLYYSAGREGRIVEIKANISGKTVVYSDFEEGISDAKPASLIAEKTSVAVRRKGFGARLLSKIGIGRFKRNAHVEEPTSVTDTEKSVEENIQQKFFSKIRIDGNLKPKAATVIIIKYIDMSCVQEENGSTRLAIPITITPYENPPERCPVEPSKRDEDYNYNPYKKIPMEIEVTGVMKRRTKYISSPSHVIAACDNKPSEGTIFIATSLPGTDPTKIEQYFIVNIDWIDSKTKEELSSLFIMQRPSGSRDEIELLKKVDVKVCVINFIAEVSMELKYVNNGTKIENIYCHRLPIEHGANIVEFTAKVDGKLIKTEIWKDEFKSKQGMFETDKMLENKATAEQEKLQAKIPMIQLTQLNWDTLGISVNEIAPNVEVVLTIKYLVELCDEDAQMRFVVPTKIIPTVPLDVEIDTIMESKITSISSPSHALKSGEQNALSTGKFVMKTYLADEETKQTNNDFVVIIELEEPKRPMVFVEKEKDGDNEDVFVLVSFVPKFHSKQASKEIIFLVDMSTKTAKEEKSSLRATDVVEDLIMSLPIQDKLPVIISKGCYFNVVRFGTFSTAVFPNGSEEYSKETMEEAIGIMAVDCQEMGERNLLGALEHVLQQKSKHGLPRQLILVIHGEVVDEDQILELVRQHAHNTTIFTVGIGEAAPKSLAASIARAGGGTSHRITSTKTQAVQLEKDAFLTEMKEMSVTWQDDPFTQLTGLAKLNDLEPLANISPSCLGNRVLLYEKFSSAMIPKEVKVSGIDHFSETLRGHFSDVVPILEDESLQFPDNNLHRLVVRKMIRELQKREQNGEDVKENIIKLALEYKLISKFTGFISKETDSSN